jgi:hypothetical protein
MRSFQIMVGAAVVVLSTIPPSFAAETVIPNNTLVPSIEYYTNNLGNNIVTTGGGNAANVGDPTGRNDDGFMALNLGFNVSFFGQTYNSLFINNNGNVSFGNGISAFVPTGPTGANAPVISPWFGDVDTRNLLSGVVHYQLNTPNQLVVTWDQVGYFNSHADSLNSFQLVLRGTDYNVPVGEGAIGFFWRTMDWERTDTSQVAAIGFGDGAGNSVVLLGSLQPGLNNIVENHHLWFDVNLQPVTDTFVVPGPVAGAGLPGLLGLGLAGLWAIRRRRSQSSIAA